MWGHLCYRGPCFVCRSPPRCALLRLVVGGVHHMSFKRTECRSPVAESLFYFLVMRELVNWMGFTSDVKPAFKDKLRTGQNVCLLLGGFEEATLYERGKDPVYIKKRFGFIKLALQYGYKVHPVYTFGEEYVYRTFPYLLKLRLKLNEFKMPGVLFFGRPGRFYLLRTDLAGFDYNGWTAAGIATYRTPYIQKYHGLYVTALQELFERYKDVYAVDPEAALEIY